MLVCPNCEHENIDGADVCDECEQSLIAQSMPKPATSFERAIMKDRIHLLEPREPLVVEPDATVAMVVKLMHSHRVGCAIVVDDERHVLGIFSERDALMRLGVDYAAHAGRPVSQFMTMPAATLREDDKIAFALHRMDLGGYRHVPITDGDRIAGVISVRDILRYLTDRLMAIETAGV
jgi:CBS domain-containing protein